MSKKVVTKYICDVCGSEHNKETDLRIAEIPCKVSDSEGRSFSTVMKKIDLCEKCFVEYENLVFDHFAIIKDVLGRIVVDKKF